jgi:hypothetical protein
MTWKHYPNSPFGNIDICEHGCTREHGSTEKECIYCDYPNRVKLEMRECKICEKLLPQGIKNIGTWHVNGKCISCSKRRKKKEEVEFT